MAKKGGLGKGLDALFLDNTADAGQGSIITVRLSQVEPNSSQPRRQFDEAALQELADSIREHGVLQPIVVRPLESDGYQIIAGERRWRASRLAGLTEVPVLVREADDKATMELALIENLQREDLNVLEEAEGYRALMDLYGLTQEEAAKRLGKSRPVAANTLRILTLPQPVLELLRQGKLTAGHARSLVGMEEAEAIEMARLAVEQGLTVRDIEKLARARRQEAKKAPPSQPEKQESAWGSSYCREAQLALGESLGRRVKISPKGEGGKLEIEFFSKEDLNAMAEALEKALKP
ncbi:MAG: ParB/RepB/Spo0J family partition protein [Oscillospiraceae bacterium]|nr:ParB/RepB/Spo0J family partition protein [Oscillospiraceae bacterium]